MLSPAIEQDAHEAFERLVGGPTRGFRLMRLYERAKQNGPLARFTIGREPTLEERFIKIANDNGFSEREACALLALQ